MQKLVAIETGKQDLSKLRIKGKRQAAQLAL
jgi:hypothetical protein